MPEDIHVTLWQRLRYVTSGGWFSATTEIYEELRHISGDGIGQCLKDNEKIIRLEIGDEEWEWAEYLRHVERMQKDYYQFISEYNGNRKSTVGLNDISIIAMAKTMGLPVISMEDGTPTASPVRRRIPHICELEGVEHLTFNVLLRRENIQI